MSNTDYFKLSTNQAASYVDALKKNVMEKGVFDSAAAEDFTATAASQNPGFTTPSEFQTVLDECGDKSTYIQKALLDGVQIYEKEHGTSCPADVIESAMHAAYSTTFAAQSQILDSASSTHHDQLSLQPNRAVVAILTTFTEAIPFAHYLPADIKSNEARLAILSHRAGDNFGGYSQNDILDGVESGEAYISSSRVHTSKPDASGAVTGKITKIQATADTCDSTAGDLKILRGRTIVYINGLIAAQEGVSSGSGNSPISGSIDISGTVYTITGNINTDTGAYSLSTSPALPATVPVTVEAFIDFERDPDLTPTIISAVDVYSLFAKSWRVTTHQTIDTRTQMSSELGLDPYSESVIAIQSQFANERHYEALRKGMRLAVNNLGSFDFQQAISHQDCAQAEAWRDLAAPLAQLSQTMAEKTIDHGITHLYIGKKVMGMLAGLPSSVFQPSGLAPRPTIFRVGRLFNQYDVYYTPKVVSETTTTAQILCVGRATNVTRNPIVLGDAVAPTVLPLAINRDLRQGAGFYARNFTSVNPHTPSAMGFGLIEVTNLDYIPKAISLNADYTE